MTMNDRTIASLLENFTAALTEVSGAAPEVIYESKLSHGTYKPDVVMELKHEGRSFRLVVEAKRSLFPRDAREAIWQLKNYLAHNDTAHSKAVPVLMAGSRAAPPECVCPGNSLCG